LTLKAHPNRQPNREYLRYRAEVIKGVLFKGGVKQMKHAAMAPDFGHRTISIA